MILLRNNNLLKKQFFHQKEEIILNKLRIDSIMKMKYYKISKLLNDATESKFVAKNGSK